MRGSWFTRVTTLCAIWLLACSAVSTKARAQVITEIMYDPEGSDNKKEWVEIFNSSTSALDLSGFKFLESENASNHGLSLAQGEKVIEAGKYVLIVIDLTNFKSEWQYEGAVYKVSGVSSFNNSGSTLLLKDSNGATVDTVEYKAQQGAAGDGGSLQRQADGSWIAGMPTPGADNTNIPFVSVTQDTSTSSDATSTVEETSTQSAPAAWSAHYSSVPAQNNVTTKLSVSAGRKRLVTTHQSVHFKAELNSQDQGVMYEWNFGDGAAGNNREVDHTYLLAGDYDVTLNVALAGNEAVSRTKVKVVDPQISIVEANPEYISIENKSKYEINLYGWQLVDSESTFIFPKDTILAAGNTIKFPSAVTKLTAQSVVSIYKTGGKDASRQDAINIAVSSSGAPKNAEQIQDITDKLVELKKELSQALENEDRQAVANELSTRRSSLNAAASLTSINAQSERQISSTTIKINSRPWYETVKRFFIRTQ